MMEVNFKVVEEKVIVLYGHVFASGLRTEKDTLAWVVYQDFIFQAFKSLLPVISY